MLAHLTRILYSAACPTHAPRIFKLDCFSPDRLFCTQIGEGLRDMHSAASDDEPLMYALAAALGAHAK